MGRLPWEHQAAGSGCNAHVMGEGTRGLAAMAGLGWMVWPGCAGMSHPG